MEELVTVATFTYPSQAVIIKARLESEGIECFMKDELTAQVNPFYSLAVGGVKIQVRKSDVPRVIPVLKELGYPLGENEDYANIVTKVVRFTHRIPFINKLPLEKRYTVLIIALALLMGLVVTLVYVVTNAA